MKWHPSWPAEHERGYPTFLQAIVGDLVVPFVKALFVLAGIVGLVYALAIVAHAGWTA